MTPTPSFLFDIVIAAKKSGDQILERRAKEMLDTIHGIKISFQKKSVTIKSGGDRHAS